MLYLKKYFTEGIIQMAILLSLCALRLDMGLEPYLPLIWHEIILGPSSALTQTQFHNLRNSLEEGHHAHTKSVDLDSFFTTRRLLGWVHSLDRLQVPHAEVQTWLVQREPDPLPMGCPDQPSLPERDSTGEERDQVGSAVEPRDGPSGLQEQEYSDIGARRAELEPYPIGREPHMFPLLPSANPCLDLELEWQDLVGIMEPESKTFDTMTSFDHTQHSTWHEVPQDVGSEALHLNCNNLDGNPETQLMETSIQHGLLCSLGQQELEHALLPLTPSAQLDDQSPAFNSSNINTLHSPPNHLDLSAEDFSLELNADNNLSVFNMNFLAPDFVESMEGSPYVECAPFPENIANTNVSFYSCDLRPSSVATSQEVKDMTQEHLASSFSEFMDHKEQDFGVEDDLHSQLTSLLEDVAMLDDIRLLDLALDEVFSPEIAARLEENVRENESQPRHQQDGEDEADSDSGLSLDFSYSPTSPCVSEASSSSSSSCSPSHSTSSCVSVMESLFSKESDSDMEEEVTVKQEEEEEDIGAVGGWHSEDAKKVFPASDKNYKLFDGFLWQGHTYHDHDHTYNQPRSSMLSSPPHVGKMPTKNTKSSPHHKIRPYPYSSSKQMSKTNVWSRDEQHSQALKIPFSNELIVNLPVEEFNNLLTNYQLNDEQVALIRHIRRRGKNKIAAQNCRKRKVGVLLGLEDEVSCLTRHRLGLLREKRKVLKKLQEMKLQLGMLYQEVFSRLRDENGRPLSSTEYLLHFGSNGSVTVASHQQEALLHKRGEKTNQKQKDKKM